MSTILDILFRHQEEKYGDFIAKLVPTLSRDSFIGIRAPEYKKIAKEVHAEAESEIEEFMADLPHRYHEENVLQTVLICEQKDFNECIDKLETFLPYIDNWAVSDGIAPRIFEKNHESLIVKIKEWIKSPEPYTKRVAMLLIMKHFLDEDFSIEYLEWAAIIRSDEYYVNMMIAWLFAEALVKQWDYAIVFLLENKLDVWVHNKTIQKARESYRITDEQKEYLKSLKRKKEKENG